MRRPGIQPAWGTYGGQEKGKMGMPESCLREERLPSGQVRRPSKVETFFSAASAYLTLLQRQGPPGFHVFENEFPSCTVRTGRARKSRMASISALNSTFST